MRKFPCIGHRGAKGLEPENTLRSVRRALELGVDGVEVDVYFVDGEIIVIHDDTLQRTTNGHGRVEEQTFGYLRSLDAGKGEKIPTLREVFEIVDRRAFINIELKGERTAEPVFELIGEYLRKDWMPEDFLVSSFNLDELAKLKYCGIRLGALFSKPRQDCVAIAKTLGAYSMNISSRMADGALVEAAHSAGMKVFVYTVNSARGIVKIRAAGADGIFTDRPDRMLHFLKTHEATA